MSEHITITLSTGHAAFEDSTPTEIARILRELADQFQAGVPPAYLRDLNGHVVGKVEVRPTNRKEAP